MKIRTGFVSNSSSSSFIAVGLGGPNVAFDKIVKALVGKSPNDITYEDLESIWDWGGVCSKDGISMYTTDGEPFFVGVDAEDYIRKDKTLSDIKKICQQLFKDKLGVNVTLSDLDLEIGEASSG